MWTPSYHRFASRTAFLLVCDAAGWLRDPLERNMPLPPAGVTFDMIGALYAPPVIVDGIGQPAEVLDPRFHVNMVWHSQDIPAEFQASLITPVTPFRRMDLPAPRTDVRTQPPAQIPAWKAKYVLAEHGLLVAAEAAVESAGGVAKLAWDHGTTWSRDSAFLNQLASIVNLSSGQIDELFIEADQIRT